MPCPHCSTTVAQNRKDGRCVACGKQLPDEMRGVPEPERKTSVSWSEVKPGDTLRVVKRMRRGDVIVLIQIHRGTFEVKALSDAERGSWSGPTYESPMDADAGTILLAQGKNEPGVEYHGDGQFDFAPVGAKRPSSKPWWNRSCDLLPMAPMLAPASSVGSPAPIDGLPSPGE
jgi:hypothetical protein